MSSYTQINTWRRCRQRWWWQYMEGRSVSPSLGQIRGSAGHIALKEYYSNGRDMRLALVKAREAYETAVSNLADWEMLRDALWRYAEWSRTNDDFEVIAVEQPFEIDIEGHKLNGIIDGLVSVKGRLWLLEHKFNKRVYLGHLDLDAQVSTYMLAAQQLDLQPAGVLYNIIRIGYQRIAKEQPVIRVPLSRSGAGLQTAAREIRQQLIELEQIKESGAKSMFDSPIPIYRNLNPSCGWDCPFLVYCLDLEDGGDGSLSNIRNYSMKEGANED